MDGIRDRNVYILGAGFSAAAGVPVVHDFIDRARMYFDDPSSGLDEAERKHFKGFLDFKRKMSQAREKVKIDLDNIEQLFGLVEISQRLGHETLETRNSTVYVIAKTLELATRSQRVGEIDFLTNKEILKKGGKAPEGFYKPDGFSDEMLAADPYDYFASLASGLLDDPDRQATRANTFITFNYDLLLDDALRRVGIEPDYCLPEENTVVEDHVAQPKRRPLLKLHGSTNWGICGNCRNRVVVLTRKVTASPGQFRASQCPNCLESEFQPMLIPPSWDKSEYRDLMKPIWSKAVEELKLASRICIVGYSMPEADSFFKYLIALALAENHNLYKFIVVDKNPHITARYRKLLEPLFRERRFSRFVDSVGFVAFLSHGGSCAELGRGELVWGNLGRR
jgi:NAD-dependent SIR2 family protein deacetylase